jgi:hypothetical protein
MRLVPFWPYRFERVDGDPTAVSVTRLTSEGPVTALAGRESVEGVVDVLDGPDDPQWLIETSGYSSRWPAGFTIESPTDPQEPVRFYLFGDGEAMIYPQGPVSADQVNGPGDLAGDGQQVIATRHVGDVDIVELAYEHGGGDWWQAHWLIPYGDARTLVISAQAPIARADATREAAELVATTVRVVQPTVTRFA